jgi:hypothetical protein
LAVLPPAEYERLEFLRQLAWAFEELAWRSADSHMDTDPAQALLWQTNVLQHQDVALLTTPELEGERLLHCSEIAQSL